MANLECALCDRPGILERGGYVSCEEHFRKLFRIRWLVMLRRNSHRKRSRHMLPAH